MEDKPQKHLKSDLQTNKAIFEEELNVDTTTSLQIEEHKIQEETTIFSERPFLALQESFLQGERCHLEHAWTSNPQIQVAMYGQGHTKGYLGFMFAENPTPRFFWGRGNINTGQTSSVHSKEEDLKCLILNLPLGDKYLL